MADLCLVLLRWYGLNHFDIDGDQLNAVTKNSCMTFVGEIPMDLYNTYILGQKLKGLYVSLPLKKHGFEALLSNKCSQSFTLGKEQEPCGEW